MSTYHFRTDDFAEEAAQGLAKSCHSSLTGFRYYILLYLSEVVKVQGDFFITNPSFFLFFLPPC